MDELYLRLAALARRFGAKRLVLFGSRARGDNRPNSADSRRDYVGQIREKDVKGELLFRRDAARQPSRILDGMRRPAHAAEI